MSYPPHRSPLQSGQPQPQPQPQPPSSYSSSSSSSSSSTTRRRRSLDATPHLAPQVATYSYFPSTSSYSPNFAPPSSYGSSTTKFTRSTTSYNAPGNEAATAAAIASAAAAAAAIRRQAWNSDTHSASSAYSHANQINNGNGKKAKLTEMTSLSAASRSEKRGMQLEAAAAATGPIATAATIAAVAAQRITGAQGVAGRRKSAVMNNSILPNPNSNRPMSQQLPYQFQHPLYSTQPPQQLHQPQRPHSSYASHSFAAAAPSSGSSQPTPYFPFPGLPSYQYPTQQSGQQQMPSPTQMLAAYPSPFGPTAFPPPPPPVAPSSFSSTSPLPPASSVSSVTKRVHRLPSQPSSGSSSSTNGGVDSDAYGIKRSQPSVHPLTPAQMEMMQNPALLPLGARLSYNLPRPPTSTASSFASSQARFALLDRERRQLFSYLSSPNCFLFSNCTEPLALTESDLDLLLLAGETSDQTLNQLFSFDKENIKFYTFQTLIQQMQIKTEERKEMKMKIMELIQNENKCYLFKKRERRNSLVREVMEEEKKNENENGGTREQQEVKEEEAKQESSESTSPFSPQSVHLAESDLDRLLSEFQITPPTLYSYIQVLNQKASAAFSSSSSSSRPFYETFQELSNGIKELHLGTMSGGGGASGERRSSKGKKGSLKRGSSLDSKKRKSSVTSGGSVAGESKEMENIHEEAEESFPPSHRPLLEYLNSAECHLFTPSPLNPNTPTPPPPHPLKPLDLVSLVKIVHESVSAALQLLHSLNSLPPSSSSSSSSSTFSLPPYSSSSYFLSSASTYHQQRQSDREQIIQFLSESNLFSEKKEEEEIQAKASEIDQAIDLGAKAAQIVGVEPRKKTEEEQQKLKDSTSLYSSSLPLSLSFLHDMDMKQLQFHSISHLISELHSIVNNNSTSDYHRASKKFEQLQAKEQAREEELKQQRTILVEYFSSATCTLFNSSLSSISISLPALNTFILSTSPYTMLLLHYYNSIHSIFSSFEDLMQELSDIGMKRLKEEKEKLWEYLSNPTCRIWRMKLQDLPLTSSSTSSSASREIKSNLIEDTSSVVITRANLDTILTEANTGFHTFIYCKQFESQHLRFNSLSHLITELKMVHIKNITHPFYNQKLLLEINEKHREKIINWLSSSECQLFSTEEKENKGENKDEEGEDTKMKAAPSSPPVDELKVKKSELDQLILEAKHIDILFYYLNEFNNQQRRFTSFSELITAMRQASQSNEQSIQQLLELLQSSQSRLFPSLTLTSPLPILSTAQMNELMYIDTTIGPTIIQYIQLFLNLNETFKQGWKEMVEVCKQLDGLLREMKEKREKCKERNNNESQKEKRMRVLNYFYSTDCELFMKEEEEEQLQQQGQQQSAVSTSTPSSPTSSSTPSSHLLLLTNDLLDRMILECGSVSQLLVFLHYLNESGYKYSSVQSLLQSLIDCCSASFHQKQSLLSYLSHHSSCHLLSSSIITRCMRQKLTLDDIDYFYIESNAGPMTMTYLIEMNESEWKGEQERSANIWEELRKEVERRWKEGVKLRRVEKSFLRAYLSSSACKLFSPPIVTEDATSPSAPSSPSLSTSHLMSPSATNAARALSLPPVRTAPLNDAELSTLLNLAGSASSAIYLLQSLQSTPPSHSNQSFPSSSSTPLFFTSATSLLQHLQSHLQDRSVIQPRRRKQLLEWLRHSYCRLLPSRIAKSLTMEDVDKIYYEMDKAAAGGTGRGKSATRQKIGAQEDSGSSSSLSIPSAVEVDLLPFCWILNSSSSATVPRFDSLPDLLDALQSLIQTSFTSIQQTERNCILAYLLSPICTLFQDRKGSEGGGGGGGEEEGAHLIPNSLWIKLRQNELDQLIHITDNSPLLLFRLLLKLQSSATSFSSFSTPSTPSSSTTSTRPLFSSLPPLFSALHLLTQDHLAGRRQLLQRLKQNATGGGVRSKLLLPVTLVESLDERDMDELTARTMDARKTMFLLDAMEASLNKQSQSTPSSTLSSYFTSFIDLVTSVHLAHFHTLRSITSEKLFLYHYLTSSLSSSSSSACTLLTPEAQSEVKDSEVERLFLLTGESNKIVELLRLLEKRKRSWRERIWKRKK